MSFKLVFENSGDEVLFKLTHNLEVAQWFLDKLARKNFSTDDLQDLDLKHIHKSWLKFQEIGDKLDTYFDNIHWYDELEDLLDPNIIADLHYGYANTTECHPGGFMAKMTSANATQKMSTQEEADHKSLLQRIRHHTQREDKHITIGDIFKAFGYGKLYRDMPKMLNSIRQAFSSILYYPFHEHDTLPFAKQKIGYDTEYHANFNITRGGNIRTSFETYLEYDDEMILKRWTPNKQKIGLYQQYPGETNWPGYNNFHTIMMHFEISLDRPRTRKFSPEYKHWCTTRGIKPVHDKIPIGCIPDLVDRIADYRKIFYRNRQDNVKIVRT